MKERLLKSVCRAVFLIPLVLPFFGRHAIAAQSQNLAAEGKESGLAIPVGTVLPVRLNQSLSFKKTKAGQAISARIMQDVPLPNGEKIPEGSKVLGAIVSVEPASQGAGGKISLHFEKVVTREGSVPVTTDLRAVASFLEVQDAQTPEFSPGFGTPYSWANTRQIGGDEVYGVDAECRGALDARDRLQALWVFSADACGVYGIEGVKIAHAGRSEPVGKIELAATKEGVVLRSGSAMLLRAVH